MSTRWLLPLVAFLQAWFGAAFLFTPIEPGTSWSAGVVAMVVLGAAAGLSLLALAARNCLRMWRLPPSEVSWSLVVAVALVGTLSALIATGPMSIGVWRWKSLVPAAYAVCMAALLVRSARSAALGARD